MAKYLKCIKDYAWVVTKGKIFEIVSKDKFGWVISLSKRDDKWVQNTADEICFTELGPLETQMYLTKERLGNAKGYRIIRSIKRTKKRNP